MAVWLKFFNPSSRKAVEQGPTGGRGWAERCVFLGLALKLSLLQLVFHLILKQLTFLHLLRLLQPGHLPQPPLVLIPGSLPSCTTLRPLCPNPQVISRNSKAVAGDRLRGVTRCLLYIAFVYEQWLHLEPHIAGLLRGQRSPARHDSTGAPNARQAGMACAFGDGSRAPGCL